MPEPNHSTGVLKGKGRGLGPPRLSQPSKLKVQKREANCRRLHRVRWPTLRRQGLLFHLQILSSSWQDAGTEQGSREHWSLDSKSPVHTSASLRITEPPHPAGSAWGVETQRRVVGAQGICKAGESPASHSSKGSGQVPLPHPRPCDRGELKTFNQTITD